MPRTTQEEVDYGGRVEAIYQKYKRISLRMSISKFKKLPDLEQQIVADLCCRKCAYWNECIAPVCPLNPLGAKLPFTKTCPPSKNKRRKLAKGLPLIFEGMTEEEFTDFVNRRNAPKKKKLKNNK